jgi:serine/threonine-protein kinase PRP4
VNPETASDSVMEKAHNTANNNNNDNDVSNNVSAADYDPTNDRIRDLHHSESQTDLLKSKDHQEKVSQGVDSQADMLASDYTEKLEQSVKEVTEIDMFSDNLDMFAATDITAGESALLTNATAASNPNLTDNWDDPEGYYSKSIVTYIYKKGDIQYSINLKYNRY